jgi:hypothetical protein
MLGGILTQQVRAQVSSDVAAKRIAQEYGVDVLRVRAGELDGTPVWLITVMTPGGNFNSAFQVTTLAVDRMTGALVPAFRQGVNGATGTGTDVGTRMDLRPDAARSGTWR